MAKPLNFNNIKKRYMTVTLADKDKTCVMITTPTKAILSQMVELQENIEQIDNELELLDEMYSLVAQIMSRNKGGIEVPQSLIESCMDFDDLKIFISAYFEFVQELKQENAKN